MERKRTLYRMIVDPQSGDPSASRFAILLLVLDIQFLLIMEYVVKKPFSAWSSLAIIIGSLCGVYGVNTGIRVWRNKVVRDKEEKEDRH